MSIETVPCGGFKYDTESLEFVNGAMRTKGSAINNLEIYTVTINGDTAEFSENFSFLADKIYNNLVSPFQIKIIHYNYDEDVQMRISMSNAIMVASEGYIGIGNDIFYDPDSKTWTYEAK